MRGVETRSYSLQTGWRDCDRSSVWETRYSLPQLPMLNNQLAPGGSTVVTLWYLILLNTSDYFLFMFCSNSSVNLLIIARCLFCFNFLNKTISTAFSSKDCVLSVTSRIHGDFICFSLQWEQNSNWQYGNGKLNAWVVSSYFNQTTYWIEGYISISNISYSLWELASKVRHSFNYPENFVANSTPSFHQLLLE